MIRSRATMGQQIRTEEKEYFDRIRRQKEAEKAEEERKRQEAEKAKYLAEQEKERAENAKQEAEKKVDILHHKLNTVSTDLGSEKKRNYFLLDALSVDELIALSGGLF